MIKLVHIRSYPGAAGTLYALLEERPPEANISHKAMPSWMEHLRFIASNPYLAWYIVTNDDLYPLGSIYLTKQREVGIFIFKACQRHGYATQAIAILRGMWPGKMLANVGPGNTRSAALFERMGARLIQHTYEL